jgi:DNA-binding transcriptional ArsR family regulator
MDGFSWRVPFFIKNSTGNIAQANTCITFASTYLHIMKARRDVYQAIADPTRRAIINLISAEPHNVNAIAEKFDVSRQAISLHVKILIDCGLITITQRGRDRFCEAQLDQLSEVSAWVDQYRKHWENKLDALESYLEKLKKQRYGNQTRKQKK